MAVLVDTKILLALVHDGLAMSKEKDDEFYKAAQSLLSILAHHLRHPLAEMPDEVGETIRTLELALTLERARNPRRRRKNTVGG